MKTLLDPAQGDNQATLDSPADGGGSGTKPGKEDVPC